jgi:hypothetical protein
MINLTKKINLSWILVCAIFALLICIVVWIHDRDFSKIDQYLPFILALFVIDIFRRNSVRRTKRIIDSCLVLILICVIYQFGGFQLLAATLLPYPGRYVDRVLTMEEMAKPSGRYATSGYTPDGNTLVSLNSPAKVPELDWSKSFKSYQYFKNEFLLVDSEGNIWYPGDRIGGERFSTTLHCVKPDGTMKWERDFHGYAYFNPNFACEKAVICSGTANKVIDPSEIPAIIECVNLDGETIWRTNQIREGKADWRIWVSRFSNNRLGLMSHINYGMMIRYFDLSDGRQLDEKFYDRLLSVFPCEMPGGKLAGLTHGQKGEKPGIGVFNSDGSVDWKFELPTKKMYAQSILTPDNGILAGIDEHLGKIDPDGNIAWYKVSDDSWFKPIGVLSNKNYLVYDEKNAPNDKLTTMYAYDSDGNVVWSYDKELLPNNHGTTVFIYQDGNILFGHKRGISLMSSDGEIIWNINPEEPNPVEFTMWNIFPASDDRIVAGCSIKKSDSDSEFKLYSFGIAD